MLNYFFFFKERDQQFQDKDQENEENIRQLLKRNQELWDKNKNLTDETEALRNQINVLQLTCEFHFISKYSRAQHSHKVLLCSVSCGESSLKMNLKAGWSLPAVLKDGPCTGPAATRSPTP